MVTEKQCGLFVLSLNNIQVHSRGKIQDLCAQLHDMTSGSNLFLLHDMNEFMNI